MPCGLIRRGPSPIRSRLISGQRDAGFPARAGPPLLLRQTESSSYDGNPNENRIV